MSTVNRTGTVSFGDASLNVWEDPVRRDTLQWQAWERQFKKDVFLRVAQQLRRLGWKTEVPAEMVEQYGRRFAEKHRYCRKGDLQGFLDISGRCIKFEMWQDVANGENPNGGRYDFGKEKRMPYLLWLEMERTRRRLRTYLCNIFFGYEFKDAKNDGRNENRGPGALTAMEWVEACWRTSWHFKGDTSAYKISDCNRKSADGKLIEHGQRVFFTDRKGRMNTGIAYYNINNMWWVVSGKYGVSNEASFSIYVDSPGDLRRKRNEDLRRKRLEGEMAKAVNAMDFKRAETLKQILFPQPEPLYLIWHKGHGVYHRPGACGYTSNPVEAGKFTWDELGRFRPKDGSLEDSLSRIIPLDEAEAAA
ncbi:hypothetical protein MHM84_01040 [Halomonas sp. McH1-25]|uniref:hypothetical protein n=1 Tax=unclassified Halomonas TaxID=2609666 RepID=UPI001EF59F75|nr:MULTISPECIES: hypothetical protein [unclassified Halomonas]MCG7598367.1 hypothetical protein [Halomonas sp. McH1-25]MCP1342691.1 hypothetical protein [Halomonas sp. FL8]MCP1363091.1 hypothetical protein [Halomonas sp. BBD45]